MEETTETEVEVFWGDLPLYLQDEIAEALGVPKDQVERETNWDVFPVFSRFIKSLDKEDMVG